MTELHQTLHNEAGICLWTILAAAAFIAVVVIMIIHLVGRGARRAYNNKKINDYNEEMSALYEANRVDTSNNVNNANNAEEYLAGIDTKQVADAVDHEQPEKLFDGR